MGAHIVVEQHILRRNRQMQRVVAADGEGKVRLLRREHRCARKRDKDLVDILRRRACPLLLRRGLSEKEVEAAAGGIQTRIRQRFKVDADRIPLRVILQCKHRLHLLRADPQIVAAVGGVKRSRLFVSRKIGEIIARRVEQRLFRERAIGPVRMVLCKKVDGRDGIEVDARVFQQVADVESATERKICA